MKYEEANQLVRGHMALKENAQRRREDGQINGGWPDADFRGLLTDLKAWADQLGVDFVSVVRSAIPNLEVPQDSSPPVQDHLFVRNIGNFQCIRKDCCHGKKVWPGDPEYEVLDLEDREAKWRKEVGEETAKKYEQKLEKDGYETWEIEPNKPSPKVIKCDSCGSLMFKGLSCTSCSLARSK